MHEDSSHAEFSAEYNRKSLRNLTGDVHARAHLFSHWDEVLPQRRLNAAARPYIFADRTAPLAATYQYGGGTHHR